LPLHPVIAVSGVAALGAAMSEPAAAKDLPAAAALFPDLLQRFAEVSDGRSDQGRVHPVAVRQIQVELPISRSGEAELLAQLYGRNGRGSFRNERLEMDLGSPLICRVADANKLEVLVEERPIDECCDHPVNRVLDGRVRPNGDASAPGVQIAETVDVLEEDLANEDRTTEDLPLTKRHCPGHLNAGLLTIDIVSGQLDCSDSCYVRSSE
jgi:hypothetical protein